MVKVKEDLTGKVLGRLTVLKQVEDHIGKNGRHYPMWLCECSCENRTIKIISGHNLTRTNRPTRSCGCLIKESIYEACHKTNPMDIDSYDYGVGWTLNTNREFYFDLEDYDKIKDYCWFEHRDDNSNYSSIMTTINGKHISMHNLLGFKNYDHIDRNTFNNQKNNLRPANSKENARNRTKQRNNTSGFVGVSWDKEYQKWRSFIKINGKMKHFGRYNNKDDAVKARLQAEYEYFGLEFAPQRHLFEQYGIGGCWFMGTNVYFFTKDKQTVQEYAPYSYELTDEPELGYLIHCMKRSMGWIPLWQAHRDGISSVREYKEAYDTGMFRIVDEYYNEYSWDEFNEEFIQFNGGISGVQKKEKLNNDLSSPFYDSHIPEYGPISHCSGPDCTYRFVWADIDYFKDPEGYEFTSHEFS